LADNKADKHRQEYNIDGKQVAAYVIFVHGVPLVGG
jgi:hypothetical protein